MMKNELHSRVTVLVTAHTCFPMNTVVQRAAAVGFVFIGGFFILVWSLHSSAIHWKKQFIFTNEVSDDSQDYFRFWNDGSCHLYFEFGGRVYRQENDSETVGIDGQKAVCLDPGLAPPSGLCVVYSFGLADDWSFDSAMETYGCDVFAFDPSIQYPQVLNKSRRIHYFNLGLGTVNTRKDFRGWKIAKLESIRKYLLHSYRPIDYLKIDIEGDEWLVLEQLLQDDQSLRDIKQIGMEVHLFPVDRLSHYRSLIQRLETSGFVRFFSRQNRWMKNAYEIAWFNANYSLNVSLSTLMNGRKQELALNNRLPPIV